MISAVVIARLAGLDRIKSGFTTRFANRLPIFGASRLPRSFNGRSLSGNAVYSQLDCAWRMRNSVFISLRRGNLAPDVDFVRCSSRRSIVRRGGRSSRGVRAITVRSASPVLALCKRLIAEGYEPSSRMEVYGGSTLALTVASIGAAAGLEVNSHVTAFIRRRD